MSLSIQNISKQYRGAFALKNFSAEINPGRITGLLGPNGAGKTTLLRIITQILTPDNGAVLLNGETLSEKHRNLIGYMPEERGLYKKMKVGEQLTYLGQIRGMQRIEAAATARNYLLKLEAEHFWNKKTEDLSKGMQQKVQFVATLLHKPTIVILDEPFSGLDPINSELIEREIHELTKGGVTIIFSTHRMEQVEHLCDSLILIDKGEKLLDGDVQELKQQYKKNTFQFCYTGELSSAFTNKFNVLHDEHNECLVQLDSLTSPSLLLQEFVNHNIQVVSFSERLPGIQQIFIQTVNEHKYTL